MSSLKDLASLIMIPSLYKDGELHTVKPLADEDVILHPDATGNHDGNDGTTDRTADNFTFSRGSNLAATRVASSGYIEKGRENLLLQSNQFDTTWSSSNVTLTSGQSGYDGTNDAWLLTKIVANGNISQSVSASNLMTFSVYAKASANDWLRLNVVGVANAYFDLANGVVGSTGGAAAITSAMVDAGGGWYRCSFTYNVASTTGVSIYVADADNDSSGTSGSIFIQDAQLEAGLVATDYIETTSSTAQAGILEDMPRLDYSGSCPALLLEPQRTNIFEQSEYFSGSYWAKTGTGGGNAPVVTQNYAVSPEGLKNASRVQFDTNGSTSSHRSGLVRDFAFTTGDKYAISCWVKSASGSDEIFTFRIAGAQVGGEKTATNEWQLFTETHTATATTTDNFGMQIRGNYSSQTSDILIYGMQLESAVSYPTSYIPTYGASVTRSVDNPIISSAGDIIDISQGTLFIDVTIDSNVDTEIYLMKFDGVNFNDTLYLYRSAIGKIQGVYRIGGNAYKQETTGAISGRFKAVFTYDSNNDCSLYVNGSKVGSSFSIPTPSVNLTAIRLGGFNDTLAKQSGLTHQSTYFPTALTSSEAIALTTL